MKVKRDNNNGIEWGNRRLYRHFCRSRRLPARLLQGVVGPTSYIIKASIERRRLLALRRTK